MRRFYQLACRKAGGLHKGLKSTLLMSKVDKRGVDFVVLKGRKLAFAAEFKLGPNRIGG